MYIYIYIYIYIYTYTYVLFRVLSACHLFQTCARFGSVGANFKQLDLHTH